MAETATSPPSPPPRPPLSRAGQAQWLVATLVVSAAEYGLATRHHLLPTAFVSPAMLLAALYAVVPRDRWRFLAAAAAIQFAALAAAGLAFSASALAAGCIALPSLAGAAYLRKRLPGGIDLTRLRPMLDLGAAAVLVALPAGVSFAMAARGLGLDGGKLGFAALVLRSILPHGLGLLFFTPLAIGALGRGNAGRRALVTRPRLMMAAGVAAVSLLVFALPQPFLLILLAPSLIAVALRFGIRETAVAAAVSLGIASLATANHFGAVAAVFPDAAHQLALLRAIYGVLFLCVLPVAATLEETQRLKAALAADHALNDEILGNISDVVFRLGLDGRCHYVTPSVRELTGMAPAQVVGQQALTRIHPEDAEAVDVAFARLARGQVDFVAIAYRSRPATKATGSAHSTPHEGWGGYVWHEAHCRLLRDDEGLPREIMASVRNVTKRKSLEYALICARERAEAAAAAKSAFLANISHEIRTPMNGVIGLTELLMTRPLDDTAMHYARLIADSGNVMMQLLNDVLDLAKIEAGRFTVADEVVPIREVLSDSLALMTASAERKGLATRLDIATDVPSLVRGDRLRLRQMLANLLGNAVKFTDAGSITLRAGIEDGVLAIEIADTGIGIAASAQAAVFEEFVQASRSGGGSAPGGGTGLGLAITQRLAQAMGGTLGLSSQPGEGTLVRLSLPLVAVAERREPEPAPVATAAPETRPLRILIAEDNATNRIIAGGMVARLGHAHVFANDGAQAVAMVEAAGARGEPFDIVLMDMLMPQMDGLAATRELRVRGYGAAALPIVAVTANAFAEDIAACLAAGMQGHVAKPLQIAALARALRVVDAPNAGLERRAV